MLDVKVQKELDKKYSEVRKHLKPMSRNKLISQVLVQLEEALQHQAMNIVLIERIKALESKVSELESSEVSNEGA